ncbi:MAG TPA: DUF2510 domain-containing protein [Flexivirga sp.]|uniref:DUF2510 domain-containing protein n=1 Tax=Flexivirga sp. TaxID=1962927 RepID=UPI002C2AF51E|nr:DUF2510 domain-containing protein [Flexivirga sp.]HWC22811.1 DUF2510 domain-containing protein [Flexivirga sp.]
MNNQTPAGWYPDPQGSPRQRYWDGNQWTEQFAPAENLASATQPIPRAQQQWAEQPAPLAKPARPWWKRRWVQITAAAVVAFFAIGGIASALSPQDNSSDNAAASPTTSASKSPAAPATVTVTATPKATHTKAPAKTVTKPSRTQHPTKSVTAAPTSWTMPDEKGKTLQAAQDDIQLVSGNPLFYSTSTDALGADRMQLWDRDLRVCAQTPRAGTTFTEDTAVDFSVVKLDETCP